MEDTSFKEHVRDLLGELPNVVEKRMFGSWGLYSNGVFFAIISDGEVYFKVSPEDIPEYEARDSHPFTYTRAGKEVSLSYWLVPEAVLEDRELLYEFAERAIAANEK